MIYLNLILNNYNMNMNFLSQCTFIKYHCKYVEIGRKKEIIEIVFDQRIIEFDEFSFIY